MSTQDILSCCMSPSCTGFSREEKIPNKFSRRHGSALSNPVFLKPPDGTLWKVYWTKKNSDEVWFVKGWKEFTKNYSLNEGHLVVFKYEETSHLM